MTNVFLFDFDGTLIKKDTLFPMSLFFLRKGLLLGFVIYIYYYAQFKFGVISNETLKVRFVKSFFKGFQEKTVINNLILFFKRNGGINISVYDSFKVALKSGDRVIVLSANFDIVVESWLKSINIDNVEVIATQLLKQDNLYTGDISGKVCRGKEKVNRIKGKIDIEKYSIISYADEFSDKHIMQLADKQYWVGR